MDKYIKLEDAININREKQIIVNGDAIGVRYPTPDEIIKDLSDLPTIEVSEDCISREWVLEEFSKGKEMIGKSEYFDELVWLVIHAPSVVPSRAEGEWKRHPIPENRAWDICTACGIGCRRRHYGFNEDGTEWVEEANYPFCPNCGAKMKG